MESSSPTVARSQNVVYTMPHDWASMARFLEPLVEKLDDSSAELQLLIVAPDADSAAEISAAAVRVFGGRPVQIIAATSAPRAARLLKLRPPQVVVGSASTIVDLMKSASLKLEPLRQLCIAWVDELLTRGDDSALETLMAEVPKDAGRVVVTSETTPVVEELLERYARRARRVAASTTEASTPTPIEHVTTSARGRLNVLRRLLDEIDPPNAVVFAREGDSLRDVNDLLRSIGYGRDDDAIRVATVTPPETPLTILFDLPASREELREAAGAASRAIALVQPRQVASLRALAAGGAVKPLTLPEASTRARETDARARAELREVLDDGKFGRALLAIEPLLDDFDGAEVAAAALTLLERERELHRAAIAATGSATAHRDPGSMVKLFVTVGSRDSARASDLVGAMANQGGVSSAEIGKVDVRESHSTVEVSANVADTLIERVNGTMIKGRRAVVRRDEPRERGERSDRGDRAPRGDRSPRGDRPPRSGGGDRGERAPRSDRGDRPDRGERGAGPGETGARPRPRRGAGE